MLANGSDRTPERIIPSENRTAAPAELADTRAELEAEWLRLTRKDLPGLAQAHCWPIRFDHCFQRVLLDHACNGVWYARINGRPAYKAAESEILGRAVELGRSVARGDANLPELNRQSLIWRGKRLLRKVRS